MPSDLSIIKVTTDEHRRDAVRVLEATYREEKQWIADPASMFDPDEIGRDSVSWYLAYHGGEPVGVLRVLFDLPLDLYASYELQGLEGGVDVAAFLRDNRVAEIGRFAILPSRRQLLGIALGLIREACRECVIRGVSHFVTDVFEGEQHSPYHFHTRVLGFELVASHEHGELNCPLRRLTLILDIPRAYWRLKRTRPKVWERLTGTWEPEVHAQVPDPDGGDGTGGRETSSAVGRTH